MRLLGVWLAAACGVGCGLVSELDPPLGVPAAGPATSPEDAGRFDAGRIEGPPDSGGPDTGSIEGLGAGPDAGFTRTYGCAEPYDCVLVHERCCDCGME